MSGTKFSSMKSISKVRTRPIFTRLNVKEIFIYLFSDTHTEMLSLPFYALYLNIRQGEVLGCSELIELVLHQVRMQGILLETFLTGTNADIYDIIFFIYLYQFLLLLLLPSWVNSQLTGLLMSLASWVVFYFNFVAIVFYICLLFLVFAVILSRSICNGFKQIYACLSHTSCIPVNGTILWLFLHTPQVAHP